MDKRKKIWLIVQKILDNHGDEVDNISIHQSGEWVDNLQEGYKIYCSEGYCWEISREKACDSIEVEDNYLEGLQNDGFVYSFCEPWDDFLISGIDKAIEILERY